MIKQVEKATSRGSTVFFVFEDSIKILYVQPDLRRSKLSVYYLVVVYYHLIRRPWFSTINFPHTY